MKCFYNYGLNLGIAFQIIDDLLDIVGSELTMGKSLGTDLDQRKPTLPLIHVLSHLNVDQREKLQADLSANNGDDRELLIPWFEQLHTADYVKQRAATFAEHATLALGQIASSDSLKILRNLPEFVLQRSK